MKSNQDQFTSTKFINNFWLNQDMVECLISKSLIVQNGQWVSFKCQNFQIVGVSSSGVYLKRNGVVQVITVESAHPWHGIDTNYSKSFPSPTRGEYASNQFNQVIESINLPLLALAGGVALLLITLIY